MADATEYSDETGRDLFNSILSILQTQRDAYPVNSDRNIPGSWGDRISVPVPGANIVVLVWLTRQNRGRDIWTRWYSGARVQIDNKRWMQLKLRDGKWQLDSKKLLMKVGQVIEAKEAEWNTKLEIQKEIVAAKLVFAEAFGVEESSVLMRSPTHARMRYEWGHIWATTKGEGRYRINAIVLDKYKEFELLDGYGIEQLVSSLDYSFSMA